jgi:mono/diheme cytochrome c family protein
MAVLTDPAYIPPAYAAADPMQGGTAYSKWWVTQAGGPGTLAGAGVTVGGEWARCKTCHAWDGRGNTASYADRTGQSTGTATRPDVSTVDLWGTIRAASPTQLFELIKGAGGRALNTQGNGHPDYSAALSDAQIWNLVKFMREGWIFPDKLYYLAVDGPPVYKDGVGTIIAPTLTFYGVGADGDATNGDAVYASNCSGCHGGDGSAINLGGLSVGEFVRTRPHEAWHKAKFGNISDSSVATMVPGILTDTADLADLYRALTNSTTYPDIP